MLWESSKNQFGRPKKRSSKFFENSPPPPPPPLEKILNPPLLRHTKSGGNDYAWDGKLVGSNLSRTCLFLNGNSVSNCLSSFRLITCLLVFCGLGCHINFFCLRQLSLSWLRIILFMHFLVKMHFLCTFW